MDTLSSKLYMRLVFREGGWINDTNLGSAGIYLKLRGRMKWPVDKVDHLMS